MIFIKAMYNQDAGVSIFPIEFMKGISKLKNVKDSLEFFMLPVKVMIPVFLETIEYDYILLKGKLLSEALKNQGDIL